MLAASAVSQSKNPEPHVHHRMLDEHIVTRAASLLAALCPTAALVKTPVFGQATGNGASPDPILLSPFTVREKVIPAIWLRRRSLARR